MDQYQYDEFAGLTFPVPQELKSQADVLRVLLKGNQEVAEMFAENVAAQADPSFTVQTEWGGAQMEIQRLEAMPVEEMQESDHELLDLHLETRGRLEDANPWIVTLRGLTTGEERPAFDLEAEKDAVMQEAQAAAEKQDLVLQVNNLEGRIVELEHLVKTLTGSVDVPEPTPPAITTTDSLHSAL